MLFHLVIQLACVWSLADAHRQCQQQLVPLAVTIAFAERWEVPRSPVKSFFLCQTGLWPAVACFLARVVEPFTADIAFLVCLFSVCFFFPFVFCRSLYPARTQIHTFSCNWFAKAYFCLYLARNIYSILRCRAVKSSHGINMRSALPQFGQCCNSCRKTSHPHQNPYRAGANSFISQFPPFPKKHLCLGGARGGTCKAISSFLSSSSLRSL